MSIRPVPTWQLLGSLLVATMAGVCRGQSSENVEFLSLAQNPYPWPTPIDSQGPPWTDVANPNPWSPISGQAKQRQLAEREAARRRSMKTRSAGSPTDRTSVVGVDRVGVDGLTENVIPGDHLHRGQYTTDDNRNDEAERSRWRLPLPWPPSFSPSWLSRSEMDQPPIDPFVKQAAHGVAAHPAGLVDGAGLGVYPTNGAPDAAPPTRDPYPRRPMTGRQDEVFPGTPRESDPWPAASNPPNSYSQTPHSYPSTSYPGASTTAYPSTYDNASGPTAGAPLPGHESASPEQFRYDAPQPQRRSPPSSREPWPPLSQQPRNPRQAAPAADRFEPARCVAMVGDQPILAGDMLGQINEVLNGYLDRMPEAERGRISEDELQLQRERLMQQLLPQMIDLKLLYLDFLRKVPKDKVDEIRGRVNEKFTKERLDELVKKAKLSSPRELDAKLRTLGSSLEHQRRLFFEQALASQARFQSMAYDEEVAPDEMLAYYDQHAKDYEYPAQARWERLMVRLDRFPTKQEAWQAIAEMGNQVVHGASLAAVARRNSHGPSAHEGGYHDWTTKGSLVSEVIDRAIFSLEVGVLSRILEDARGYHIVRVIERRDAGKVSFLEAQVEIAEKIRASRRKASEQAYLARLRHQTRVWTVFDGELTAQRPPEDTRHDRGGSSRY